MSDRTETRIRRRERPASRFTRIVATGLAVILAHGAPAFPTLAAPSRPVATAAAPAPAPAPAFDIEKVFPSGSLFVASIADFAKTQEAMKGTALYAIWTDPQVQKFLEKPKQMLEANSATIAQQMESVKTPDGKPIDPKKLLSVFGGEIAFGLTGFSVPQGGPNAAGAPDVGLVLVFKIGDEAALDGLLATVESMAKNETPNFAREKVTIAGVSAERMGEKGEPFQLYHARTAGYAVFSPSEKSMGSILGALAGGSSAPSLGSDANYAAVAKTTRRPNEIATLYVNFAGILSNLEPVLPPQAKAAIDTLGLRGLQSMSVTSAFEGKGFIDVSSVHTTGEKKGILRLTDGPPIDAAALGAVPKDVVSFSLFNFDSGVLWSSLWDTLKAVDPAKESEARQMLAGFESQVGVKFKEDLIDCLGSRMVTFQRAAMPGQMLPDFAFFLQVKSADKLRDTMSKLTKLAQGASLKEVKIADNTYYYLDLSAILPIPLLQPSYAFVDDNLVLSLNLQSLKSIVNARKAPTFVSVRENEEFKTFLPKIPQTVTSIGYNDVKKSFGATYDQLRQFVPLIAMQLGNEMPVDLALLPTSDAFTRHLYGSYAYSVDNGADSTSISVGPMSMLVVGGTIAVVAGLGAAFMPRSASIGQFPPQAVEAEEDEDDSEPR